MAHISLIPSHQGAAVQLLINGHDFSHEVFRAGMQIVEVGDDPEFSEVGFQVTFAVSRLDLDGHDNVVVTDHLREVAQRVRTMTEVSA